MAVSSTDWLGVWRTTCFETGLSDNFIEIFEHVTSALAQFRAHQRLSSLTVGAAKRNSPTSCSINWATVYMRSFTANENSARNLSN